MIYGDHMSKYYIADMIVEFQNRYDYLDNQCHSYLCNKTAPAEVSVLVTEDELRQERILSDRDYSNGYLESVCAYRKLCIAMTGHDGMLLHSSVISVNGRGIAFLAPSGTGKTTHTVMWKRLLGDQCTIINGDKPIVRFFDGVPYAYGTPWAGKENLATNAKVRLTDLCFICRDDEDSVQSLTPAECIDKTMIQILRPKEPAAALKTLELVDKLLHSCRLWQVNCTPTVDAAKTAYTAIISKE